MARRKALLPTCPVQARCEGFPLRDGRTMCPRCEAAMAQKRERPLRGERHLMYEESRRGQRP